MLKAFLLAVGMIAASATLASADGWRSQNHEAPYGNDYGSSALSRYCPPGQYPHSWPNGGWRCQYANGDFSGAGNW